MNRGLRLSIFGCLFAVVVALRAAEVAPESSAARVILVAGAVGDPEFAPDFDAQIAARNSGSPSLVPYCQTSLGTSRKSKSGKLSGEGSPPAKEKIGRAHV